MSTTILITMLVLFALSVPIAVSIGLASVVGIAGFSNLPLLLVAQSV
jgi:C4-dicarboxylate transporter, DctM subunit